MLLPENGSVVIIDDSPNEAMPILRALSKRGISTTYYKGNEPNDLPARPIQSVRIVFLDLQLINTNDEHQIAKSVVNVLNAIISEENGPYILVKWSKNQTKYGAVVDQEIRKVPHLVPACYVSFNKRDCLEENILPLVDQESFIVKVFDKITGRFEDSEEHLIRSAILDALSDEYITEFKAKENAVDLIENYLENELKKAGVFHLFVIWENLTKRSAAKMVNKISGLNNKNHFWEANTRNLIKRMGIARVGNNQVSSDILVKESINTLNFSLVDSIEREMKQQEIPQFLTSDSEIITANTYESNDYILRHNTNMEELLKNTTQLAISEKRDSIFKAVSKNPKIDEKDKKYCDELIKRYNSVPYDINTTLHIEENPSQELIPGNIYLVDGLLPQKKQQYLETFFKSLPPNTDEYILIDLEVSPICDYAQNKWKRSRTLPGVIYPVSNELRKGAFYDVQPTFNIANIECRLAFDFHLFYSNDKGEAKKRIVKYRLKRELLLDIVAQLSAHVNRPGISFVQ